MSSPYRVLSTLQTRTPILRSGKSSKSRLVYRKRSSLGLGSDRDPRDGPHEGRLKAHGTPPARRRAPSGRLPPSLWPSGPSSRSISSANSAVSSKKVTLLSRTSAKPPLVAMKRVPPSDHEAYLPVLEGREKGDVAGKHAELPGRARRLYHVDLLPRPSPSRG